MSTTFTLADFAWENVSRGRERGCMPLCGIQQHWDFNYYGLRQSKKSWPASQFEVREQSKSGSSLLAVDSGSEKPQLGRTDFDFNQPDVQGEE
jgi:hypothetical protein